MTSFFLGMGMVSASYAEDFDMINHEKSILTIHTQKFSISNNQAYAQYLDWEDRIKQDTQAGFEVYLGHVDDAANIAGNAPIKDVVPGTGRARKGISKGVRGLIQNVRDLYNSFIEPDE
jgi:hypothetical protein